MLQTYLNTIQQDIRQSEKVLAHRILMTEHWTKSCFDLLSTLIREDLEKKLSLAQSQRMGTTLSAKTLQKIFKGAYRLSYPIDPRTLNTLTKLVLFLDFKDWNDYVLSVDKRQQSLKKKIKPKKLIKQIVREAVENQFKIYASLPQSDTSFLDSHFIKNGPAYLKIMDVVHQKRQSNWVISNFYNPSTCEILDIKVKKIGKKYAQVITTEYWLLCWWHANIERYVLRYKNMSEHHYILNKVKETWLIKTDVTMADFNTLEGSQTPE